MSLISRVLRVDRHVLVREVGEEDLGLGALAGQADRVLDLLAGDGLLERRQVERHRGALRADLDVLDPDVERQRRGAGQRGPDRLGDAAPVGVAAVQRRLDQRRVGDGAGGGVDGRLVAAVDDDAADAPGALAVAHDQQREAAQHGVERLAEAQLVLGLGRHAHAARPARHQDRGVVGRELAVDRDAVEGALHAHAEQQVGRLGLERRIGLDEAEHRGEGGRDHPGALRLRGQAHAAARQRDVERDALGEQVGGADRLAEGLGAVGRELAARGEHPLDDRVGRQRARRSRRSRRPRHARGRRRPPSPRPPASSRRRRCRGAPWRRWRCRSWPPRRAGRRAGSAPGTARRARRARPSA